MQFTLVFWKLQTTLCFLWKSLESSPLQSPSIGWLLTFSYRIYQTKEKALFQWRSSLTFKLETQPVCSSAQTPYSCSPDDQRSIHRHFQISGHSPMHGFWIWSFLSPSPTSQPSQRFLWLLPKAICRNFSLSLTFFDKLFCKSNIIFSIIALYW